MPIDPERVLQGVVDSTDATERLTVKGGDGNKKAAQERVISRLRLLWERRRFLVRVTGCGLLAATLVAFLTSKRYESTARLMPPDSQSGSGMALMAAFTARTGAGLGPFASDLLGMKTTGSLFVGVLSSRSVQTRLVEQFNLRQVYGLRSWDDARKQLSENTRVSEDRKSGIITVTVSDHSPQRAAALANTYIDELNRLVVELTTSSAHRERVFLEERLKSVQHDLESAEKDFSQFASKNTAINISEQGKAMVEAAATLQGRLIAAQSELESLRQIYADNNVRVRAIRAQIAELQRQLEKLDGEEQGVSATSRENGQSPYPSIRKLPLLGVPYADLYRRIKVQETVFEILTQEYELAKVAEAKETPSVRLLDAANVPEKKSFPPRTLMICVGTFLSWALGMAWVLGTTHWSEIDQEDPAKVLATEVWGTLKADLGWTSDNGHGFRAKTSAIWRNLRR